MAKSGFSAVVIVTLALGIGGTTAVFSVLEAVLLAPLPYEQPGQLVRFYQQEPDKPATRHYLTGAHFSSIRDAAASFESTAALANYRETGVDLVRQGHAQRLRVLRVTFRVDRALTFEMNLPSVRYNAERYAAFQEELARRLRTISRCERSRCDLVLSSHWELSRLESSIITGPRAGTSVATRDGFNIQHRTVSGDVYAALEIPVLAGRVFDGREEGSAPPRAVVSANFARTAFPHMPFDSVIGQRISAGGRPTLEIIGVVGNVALDVYGAPSVAVYHFHRQFANNRNWTLSVVRPKCRAETASQRVCRVDSKTHHTFANF